ncbi:MAG: type IV secretion system DNA-binding domain-containing protein, partial [Defluviicoccus sp.]|nr:type IV secretion system DNA-binding domain-containing protein [Defluviicoccus sp.]
GYLKFPGPFPVASIKLKYVARPAAAERFVPREGDGAEPNTRPVNAADAADAPGEADPDEDEIRIPEPAAVDEATVAGAPDRDTAQWSADSLGRSEVEEVAEGYSYGANTIRDGVSLTPRRELRALALPSEIMRLANLEGYLKFPGPFPVASIKLKYVARPAAAERFVPREGDGAEPNTRPANAADAADAPGEAVPDEDEIRIPEPAVLDEAGLADAPDLPELPPEPASWQGQLDLLPLPEEAGGTEADAAASAEDGSTRNGHKRKGSASRPRKSGMPDERAPDTTGKAPEGDAATPVPGDGATEDGSGPEFPPSCADGGDGRGQEWL